MPDSPASLTPFLGLGQWNDGDNPGAAALNENWLKIDQGVASASDDNINVSIPLTLTGNTIGLSIASNLKLTGNTLDTTQGLKTSSSPTFEDIFVKDNATIGTQTADGAFIIISGSIINRGTIFSIGDIGLSGNIYSTGSIYTKANSYVTGSFYVSGSTYQSGSIYATTKIGTKKLYVNKYEAPPTGTGGAQTGSETDQFMSGIGTPANVDFYVSGATELRGNILITGSVTINGTYYGPTGSFGYISSSYIDSPAIKIGTSTISGDGANIVVASNSASFNFISASNIKTDYIEVANTASFANRFKLVPRFQTNTSYEDLTFFDGLAKIVFSSDSPFLDADIDFKATNITISASNTLTFLAGTTTGLTADTASYFTPTYASFYNYDNAYTINVASSGVYYPVTASMTSSLSSSQTTFVSGSAIRVEQPGTYGVDWAVSVRSATNNQTIEAGIMLDSTMKSETINMSEAVNSGKCVNIAGNGIVYASASQKFYLAVENVTAANNIVLEHANFKLIRLK